MKITLMGGAEIADPDKLVAQYYEVNANELYDRLDVPQDDNLDLASLASLAFVEIQNPPLSSWQELWKLRAMIDTKLREIPPSMSITDSDLPYQSLQDLFTIIISIDHFRIARASKILHKKRPALIPILDSRVIETYCNKEMEEVAVEAIHLRTRLTKSVARQNILRFADLVTPIIKSIRADVISNHETLTNIQEQLGEKGLFLTLCRVFDVILWEHSRLNTQ